MFFPMTPEMINTIIESNKKKAPLSFEAYYNKRFMEECKYVADTPTFRLNYIEVTTHLQQAIRAIALKEYNEKWPLVPIIKINNELDTELIKELDNKSVISDYDILDECDAESVQSVKSEVEELQPTIPSELPRRSKRLIKQL
jgi:hypothetical protein